MKEILMVWDLVGVLALAILVLLFLWIVFSRLKLGRPCPTSMQPGGQVTLGLSLIRPLRSTYSGSAPRKIRWRTPITIRLTPGPDAVGAISG